MDADVQAFIDKWAEKSAAKRELMVALGEAKLADYEGRDADARKHWATVEAKGMHGHEGKAYAEAFALAEAYVAGHPDQFISFESYVNPESHDMLVKLCGVMGKAGRYEEEAKLQMFELVRFERQHIGQAMQVVVRPKG